MAYFDDNGFLVQDEPESSVPFLGNQSAYEDAFSYYTPISPSYSPSADSGLGGVLNALLGSAKDLGKGLMSPRGIVGLLGMLYGRKNTRPDYGGGEPVNIYPKKITRTIVPSKYGSVAQYAADGGLMQAYATGGVVTGTHKNPLQMEDGGFVMTADAVKGAGGPQGLAQYIPQSEFIVGKGTGKSDDIPATIGGTTPARVSNGEAYIPKAAVKQAGGAPALYALMNQLQRRA